MAGAMITMHGYLSVFIAVVDDERVFQEQQSMGGKVLRCDSWTAEIHADVLAHDGKVFLYGDLASVPFAKLKDCDCAVVHGFCRNVPAGVAETHGRPEVIHNLGVFIRNFFLAGVFQKVQSAHRFGILTESTKTEPAHRTGVYLSSVREDGRFHLLRCSTNLDGPTEAFQMVDTIIVAGLNLEAGWIFTGAAPLNHVLAQIYRNTPAGPDHQRQAKARIAAHSDKTKDMPANAIMAFCTFYDRPPASEAELTHLRFRRKDDAPDDGAPREWSIALHPDSVFFIPLQTNRTYTHEIRPSKLNASVLPTRMGYVVRCSRTEAIHCDGQTHILVPLKPPTTENLVMLRCQYMEENCTSNIVDYGNVFFSMNSGDYKAPLGVTPDDSDEYDDD